MRVLIVDTCYAAFLRGHYARNPGLDRAPYATQWRSLMDTFFGTADSYSHHLAPLGHDAHEVVANCGPLQQAWAREHGLDEAPEDEIVLAQARDFGPDVVYVQNLSYPSDRLLAGLRRTAGLVAGQIASAPPPAERLRAFDLVLTSFPHYVERFRALGVDAEYFRIGFDARVLERLVAEGAPAADGGAVFVGALNRRRHGRANGVLARAARRAPIDFWGYGARGWPPWSPVRRRYRGESWGLDMFRVLRNARIALNRHIREADGYANNMRLYEATGVGTLLVTDEKANLAELFEPGREVVTYANADELADRVLQYLADDDARRTIAEAGQRRTLREHGYDTRMKELAAILQARL
jgi:spore maturation protein CgeB